MKIAGIIAEYDPFHLGHAWHIAETRRRTGCDRVICCMSGHVTQRGTFTCLTKWERARMALLCGADAVFELPALFSVRTADHFAWGGVALLDGLGCDLLSFGCEMEDLEALYGIAALREEERPDFSRIVRSGLDRGESHARAWGNAAASVLGLSQEAIQAPNTLLAAEYLRALQRLGSGMAPIAIKRRGAYHANNEDTQGFASAEQIRAWLRSGDPIRAAEGLPEQVRDIFCHADHPKEPDDLLLYILRNSDPKALRALPDVPEGIENRILREAHLCASREALIESVKCKRYTYARISRILAHALIGLDASLAERHPHPEYARLLGMRTDATPLLSELKRRAHLPIVSSPAQLRGSEIFALECRATDIRSLLCREPENRVSGREFTEPFLRVDL